MTVDSKSIEDRLRRIAPQIAGAEEILVDTITEAGRIVQVDRGSFVFRAGDSCAAFLLLLEGTVRVQLTAASGREVTLYRISAGGTCILTTSRLLGHDDYPAEAIAETDVQALAIPSSFFQQVLESSPSFRTLVFDGFSKRLSSVIQKIDELVFTAIDVRLASALVRIHRDNVESITHQQLAVELGTAREVVSRHLKRFEKSGWVRLGRGSVQVIDAESLSSLTSDKLV